MTIASWPEATSAVEPEIIACTGTTAPGGLDPPTRSLLPTHENDLYSASSAASVSRVPKLESIDRPGRRLDALIAEYDYHGPRKLGRPRLPEQPDAALREDRALEVMDPSHGKCHPSQFLYLVPRFQLTRISRSTLCFVTRCKATGWLRCLSARPDQDDAEQEHSGPEQLHREITNATKAAQQAWPRLSMKSARQARGAEGCSIRRDGL